MTLPHLCPTCLTDDYAGPHLRACQEDAAAIIALYGPRSPEMGHASRRTVEAMAVWGRRLACRAVHPTCVEVTP